MTSETMPKEHKRRSGWLSQDRRSASCVAEDVVGEGGGHRAVLGRARPRRTLSGVSPCREAVRKAGQPLLVQSQRICYKAPCGTPLF